MSEMQSNRGVVKELYLEIENPEEKIIQLHFDTKIPFDDLIWFYEDEPQWNYIENQDYMLVLDRLFDVSEAPDTDDSNGERDEIKKVSENRYEIDFYYYNGGTNLNELFADGLEAADKAFEAPKMAFYGIIFENQFLTGQTGIAGPTYQGPTVFAAEGIARSYMEQVYGVDADQYQIVTLVQA